MALIASGCAPLQRALSGRAFVGTSLESGGCTAFRSHFNSNMLIHPARGRCGCTGRGCRWATWRASGWCCPSTRVSVRSIHQISRRYYITPTATFADKTCLMRGIAWRLRADGLATTWGGWPTWPTAAIPMDNPYCSCKPTTPHGLQLQLLWRIPAAAASRQLLMAHSCNPCGERCCNFSCNPCGERCCNFSCNPCGERLLQL